MWYYFEHNTHNGIFIGYKPDNNIAWRVTGDYISIRTIANSEWPIGCVYYNNYSASTTYLDPISVREATPEEVDYFKTQAALSLL